MDQSGGRWAFRRRGGTEPDRFFSRTSSAAKSMLVPQPNSMVTSDTPARDRLVMRCTPETTATASSIGFVTRFSTSFGAACEYLFQTVRVG